MELKEFLEMYLPDYKKQSSDYWRIHEYHNSDSYREFYEAFFPEAFSAYEAKQAEKLQENIEWACKLQRDTCAELMTHYYPHDGKLFEALTHTNQPSMEDILNGTEN